jgi:hypothetical protein
MGRSRNASVNLRLPLGAAHTPVSALGAVSLAVLVAFAVAIALVRAVPMAPWMRAALSVGVIGLAAVIHHFLRQKIPPPGYLIVGPEGVLRFERGRAAMLVDFDEPIGVAVFASVDRATFRVALTSPRATRYVGARVRDADDAAAAPTLLERASTAADADLLSGEGSSLTAADGERLVAEIARRAPGALDRLYLSDAGGEPIVLDRAELRVGARRIDLCAPLEWHASLFQELGGYAVSLFQATWVRQRDVEVVLVAPMPAEGSEVRDLAASVRAGGDADLVRTALARDVRLMQAAAADPPPRELRRAIDRPFMLPLRRALDRAPRVPRAPSILVRPATESRRAGLHPREKIR